MTDLGGRPHGQPERRPEPHPRSHPSQPPGTSPDAHEATPDLRAALTRAVRGDVAFDTTARALTTMDASNYRRVPLGVVSPRDADDIAATLAVCRDHGIPVVPRGGGTSIAGQATGTGIVLDLTRHMNRILDLDPATRTAVVQPGTVLDRLQEAAAPHGLRFGPDPSTHSRCTLGGMIGNNSCGTHSVAWGTTADNVRTLTVIDSTGRTARLGRDGAGAPDGLLDLVTAELALLRTGYPDLPRRISGYALDALLPEHGTDVARAFCGTEGTWGILTEAEVHLVAPPPARALAVLGYPDESAAADAAAGLLPYRPLTVEGMAADLVPDPAGLPRGGAWLFVETGGTTPAEARAHADTVVRTADVTDALVVTDPAAQRALWRIREDASGTATRIPAATGPSGEAWPGWEDCAVPPARLGAYLHAFRALLADHHLRGTPYGHFGDGCVHVRIDFDLVTTPGIARFRRFSEDLAHLVVAHGGSLSGEHGDGQARAELLPAMYGPDLVRLFERAKDLWDPHHLLNPGILVRPHRLDENLRFAPLPRRPVDVAFGYPDDAGDFTAAVRRCVGVAKCRTAGPPGHDVMCPSYRATGDETHSTRGRARLLHEMLAGEIITDGWRSTEVRDALDLCLSCKGCRSDCPVGVDMATYKAEFLHHHYAGRRRPLTHYTLGRLPRWLTAVTRTRATRAVNALAALPPAAALAKRLAGIAPDRTIPRLAPQTFTRWWAERLRDRARAHPSRHPTDSPRPESTSTDPTSTDPTSTDPTSTDPTGVDPTGHGTDPTGHGTDPTGTGISTRSSSTGISTTVLLWPDTFTEHLAPSVGRAAVRVLEDAGLTVLLPPHTTRHHAPVGDGVTRGPLRPALLTPRTRGRVCCGLTYTTTGQLDHARTVLRRTLDLLEPQLAIDDLPVVVLEPSCAAALRTDLPELLPDDPRAHRLAAAVVTFAQALERHAPHWTPPRLDRPVAGQTHCHQHAVLGDGPERRLRAAAGLTGTLSGGCCGLAGNFGFEKGHEDVSRACAEEQLLPAVRAAGPDAVILADGYSCRTQLAHLGDRTGRHLAEVLAEALRTRAEETGSGTP